MSNNCCSSLNFRPIVVVIQVMNRRAIRLDRIALVKPLSSTQHGQPTQRAASDGLLKVARILWLRGRRRVALDLRICLLICTTVTLFSAHRAQYSQQVYTCSVSFAMPNRIAGALLLLNMVFSPLQTALLRWNHRCQPTLAHRAPVATNTRLQITVRNEETRFLAPRLLYNRTASMDCY